MFPVHEGWAFMDFRFNMMGWVCLFFVLESWPVFPLSLWKQQKHYLENCLYLISGRCVSLLGICFSNVRFSGSYSILQKIREMKLDGAISAAFIKTLSPCRASFVWAFDLFILKCSITRKMYINYSEAKWNVGKQ